MSRTYKATGINLKSMPLGESDRLLTILTREYGLIRAVATGSRKHNSRIGGRSELFVVNELLIAKGKSLDKVTQAETVESYPGLGQDLKKLIAGQYLAELCLCQALSDQPQEELFCLLNEHLERLERSSTSNVLAHLTHAVFQLLVLAGIAPQVHTCCLTRESLVPDLSDPNWRTGFSTPAGGTVTLAALEKLVNEKRPQQQAAVAQLTHAAPESFRPSKVAEDKASYGRNQLSSFNIRLTAAELLLLQQLAQADLPEVELPSLGQALHSSRSPISAIDHSAEAEKIWHSVERILRHYAQYHFDRSIRSAALIDACFTES